MSERFIQLYGCEPDLFVRAPGRVNLIGEHVDYCGYPVLPMAIRQDMIFAVKSAQATSNVHLELANMDSKRFAKATFEFKQTGNGTPDIEIDASISHWTNYFLCGYKGVIHELGLSAVCNMQVLGDGSVPTAAGLSSSSALVVASALATLAANDKHMRRVDLARVCIECEKFVGVEGGGMDQTISLLAQHGVAKHIQFHPTRTTTVHLPQGSSWLVAHTLVESQKQRTAATKYNKRVIECRFAGIVLARALGITDTNLTLKQLQDKCGLSLEHLLVKVEEVLSPEPYTTAQLEKLLGGPLRSFTSDLKQASKVFCDNEEENSKIVYLLHHRAKHVFSEALRVQTFLGVCNDESYSADEKISKLGVIMNQGHESCDQLYHCSCDELNALQSACVAGGAIGARLTGAGWGGCCVVLVRDADVDAVLASARDMYYSKIETKPDNEADYLFVTKPANGAAIVKLQK
jgi:N-acetylgalactosamine kinase